MPTTDAEVVFDAGCSTGDITEYRWWWDWDWEGPETEPDEVQTSPVARMWFEVPGAYYVRLVIVDGNGAESDFVDYLHVQ
jgi:hypothetical protein